MWRISTSGLEQARDGRKSPENRLTVQGAAEGGEPMDAYHRAIRSLLKSMSPRRAVKYIQSFQLPPEEELFLIECDVRGLSYVQAADEHSTTPEVIKRRRQRAYAKIADEINHGKGPRVD